MTSRDEPISPDAFVKALQRSGLLDEARIQMALKQVPKTLRERSETLAEHLISHGVLSRYQGTRLLNGGERGLVLGPYQLLAPIARGGMGAVFLARDSRDQRLVALKLLPPQKYREEERLLARFRREMEITRKVSHAHLTRTFETGVLEKVYYIAMEYVPGQSLRRKVADVGPLPVSRVARVFSQVSDALQYAHGLGLIHRDLKPSNIMITPNGHAKILDLGLALIEGEDLPDDKTIVGGKGYVVGTMDYIAPEQVEDPTAVDARADLYSMGCSLYFVLCGQPPFPGGSSRDKIKRHLNDWPELLTDLNPTVPSAFARLIERLMAKRPEHRPASAEDVRRFLAGWVGNEPELPMDTAADNAHPREIFDLETDKLPEGSFWETMPGTVFLNESTTRLRRKSAKSGPSLNLILILAGVALGGLLLLIAAVIVAVYLLR